MDTLETKMPANCLPSEELVALLYDELDGPARTSMEDHLAGCNTCADEFADLSFARLDVYEWHRDEFVEMATPRIVIPYAEAVTRTSWVDPFRSLFAFSGQWATAGAAFAAVAVVLVGVWLYGSKPVELAGADNVPPVIPVNERPVAAPTPKSVDDRTQSAQPVVKPEKVSTAPLRKQSVQSAKAPGSQPASVRRMNQSVPPKQRVAPRLNDFDDEDDTTLRLGDLLAEVDTRD